MLRMHTTSQIIELIGVDKLAQALQVSPQAISNVRKAADGRFPARWYFTVRDLYGPKLGQLTEFEALFRWANSRD
jgi:hypothetical protein